MPSLWFAERNSDCFHHLALSCVCPVLIPLPIFIVLILSSFSLFLHLPYSGGWCPQSYWDRPSVLRDGKILPKGRGCTGGCTCIYSPQSRLETDGVCVSELGVSHQVPRGVDYENSKLYFSPCCYRNLTHKPTAFMYFTSLQTDKGCPVKAMEPHLWE